MSILTIQTATRLSDLESWGSISQLGAEILDDSKVNAFGKATYGAPTDPISAGYFGTTKGRYRLVYPFSEQATILAGQVRITDEVSGQEQLYGPGDTWFITKGTSTIWEVLSDEYTKHYLSFV